MLLRRLHATKITRHRYGTPRDEVHRETDLLEDGYTDVADGKVAFVATSLQMLRPVASRPERAGTEFAIRPVARPDLGWYRELYGRIGTDWLWFSRLHMAGPALQAILHHPDVEVYALAGSKDDEGLLELDFRVSGQCEIAYFGVTAGLVGGGAGRRLMNHAIAAAWRRPIGRLWVHTCNGDHPAALQFYIRSGFAPFKRQIEIADDPRLTGLLPETAAPHIPLIRPHSQFMSHA